MKSFPSMMTLKNIAQEILSINENVSYLAGLGYKCRIGGIEGMGEFVVRIALS